MLLDHIDDLISSTRKFQYSYEIYEAMIEAWLTREEKYVSKALLREFSELVAVDIYTNREVRKAEKITSSELSRIANAISPEIADWQNNDSASLTNRSLLNRDAEGNRKFSHRSIMEYLFIIKSINCLQGFIGVQWTDQMYRFWYEIVSSRITPALPISVASSRVEYLRIDVNRLNWSRLAVLISLLAIYRIKTMGSDQLRVYYIDCIDFSWAAITDPENENTATSFFVYNLMALNMLKEINPHLSNDAVTDVSDKWRRPTTRETMIINIMTAIQHGYKIHPDNYIYPIMVERYGNEDSMLGGEIEEVVRVMLDIQKKLDISEDIRKEMVFVLDSQTWRHHYREHHK
jgi:hypothetical protein